MVRSSLRKVISHLLSVRLERLACGDRHGSDLQNVVAPMPALWFAVTAGPIDIRPSSAIPQRRACARLLAPALSVRVRGTRTAVHPLVKKAKPCPCCGSGD